MKVGRQEAMYMGCEAKLWSKDQCDNYTNKPRENRGQEGTACGLHSQDGL